MKYKIRDIEGQKEKVVKNQMKNQNIIRRKKLFKSQNYWKKNAEELRGVRGN